MKKYSIIILILFIFQKRAYSQDPAFPAEKVSIVLSSGKEIKDARLWQIHFDRLEYEKAGSLHDVTLNDVTRIESDDSKYSLADGKLIKQPGDTASGKDYFKMGKADARKYFRKGSHHNSKKINEHNPNFDLFYHNDAYKKGYVEGVKAKKSRLFLPD